MFPTYQFRDFYGNDYSPVDGIYAVWEKDKLVKVIHRKSFWDNEYTYLKRRGLSFSGVYYASLIENNILNIHAENKLFVDEVKIQLGIIPRPESKISMSGGYSPQLMQILISECKRALVKLDKEYTSKKISKKEYLERKKGLQETLAEAQKPRLTAAEEERVRGFIKQLEKDYPLNAYAPSKTIRIDSLSFVHIVFKDNTENKTPLAIFKLTFLQEHDYQVFYRIKLLPQTEYNKLETLMKEEENIEKGVEEKATIVNTVSNTSQINQNAQPMQKKKESVGNILLNGLLKGMLQR